MSPQALGRSVAFDKGLFAKLGDKLKCAEHSVQNREFENWA